MLGEKFSRSLLVVPGKTARAVGREFNVIWRISVHKVAFLNRHFFHIDIREFPVPQYRRITCEIRVVVNRRVRSEGNIKLPAFVETAQSVKASAVEIVEQLRCLFALRPAVFAELIEPLAMPVEEFLFVAHLDALLKATLKMSIEVNEMRIDVVEQRAFRLQAQRYGQAAAERFDVSPIRVSFPNGRQVRNEPALATSPLQGRLDRFLRGDC